MYPYVNAKEYVRFKLDNRYLNNNSNIFGVWDYIYAQVLFTQTKQLAINLQSAIHLGNILKLKSKLK